VLRCSAFPVDTRVSLEQFFGKGNPFLTIMLLLHPFVSHSIRFWHLLVRAALDFHIMYAMAPYL
jgi:hypothetical protein